MALLSPRSTMNATENALMCEVTYPDLLMQEKEKKICSHVGAVV